MSILNRFQRIGSSCLGANHLALGPLGLVKLTNRYYSSSEESADDASKAEATDEKPERLFFKEQQEIDGFKVFDVYMNKKRKEFDRGPRRVAVKTEVDAYARYNKMSTDQDWTSVWPTPTMFKQNAVPFPVRMGFVKNNSENSGLPPVKYANTELIKIPNFLHLTPPHIKKQCETIKKFCTPWPAELKTDEDCERHFPVEVTTSTYIYDGPSLRDDRARSVTLQVKVASLNLDERARDKLIRLAQHRYDDNTDTLTIVADRCPYRRQNEDYAEYLLTTLYHESKQIEDWEEEITEEDRRKYVWEKTRSKQNIVQVVSEIEKDKALDEQSIVNLKSVQDYKQKVTKIFDEGESEENMLAYKNSVLNMLKLGNKSA